MNLGDFRRQYTQKALTREGLNSEPVQQFALWFKEACNAGLPEPNATSLATVDEEQKPALRTVLLKYFDEKGFVFFTNYESSKAQHIAENPWVALLFPWIALQRQVIIRGEAIKISVAESLKYFLSRPVEHQIGAWVSNQSSVISSRKLLELKFKEMKRKFSDGKVPLPSFWGGYRVEPYSFEFWQGQPSRLHDRFLYRRSESGSWQIECLAP